MSNQLDGYTPKITTPRVTRPEYMNYKA